MINEYYAVIWAGADFDDSTVRLVGPLPAEIDEGDLVGFGSAAIVLPMSWLTFSREGEGT
jgi:hypothetical protein